MDGIVHTYKDHLVAKGYTNLYRVDYEETFSPIIDIRAIRILIFIAVFYDYEIWQMDVKTALLNGYLDEDIYMVQPEDDIIIMGNHIPSLQSVKDYLRKCFAMKDLGEAAFILGIKIYRDRSKQLIGLGQNDYKDKILKIYKMDNFKRGHIPMQERLDLNKTQESATRILNMVPNKKVDKTPYELWYGKVSNLSYLKDTQRKQWVTIFLPPENKIVVVMYAEFIEKNLITQKVSGRVVDLEEIQDKDTSPSEITSEIPMEVEGFESPQKEVISIRRSVRTHQTPDRLCLNVEVEEHSLGDLNEPASYKAAIDRSKRLIELGQNAYMDKILKRYKMDNFKHGHIPMQERLDLNKTQGALTPKEVKRMQNVPYASVVGSIMHAVRCTRHDVAFAQNIASRFQQNPAGLQVVRYCDAGFETDRDDTKSQTEYVFILNGGAVDWKSFKQRTTAISATEAEYIAALEATMEAIWIRNFISGLGIVPAINEPVRMFCDNSAALHFANEPGVQRGARHYHRRYHYVRESIALGEIRFLKVHTYDNLDDLFTKALSNTKLTQHARSMGLRLASSFMYGYLSDEYKDKGGNKSDAKPSFSDISKATTCMLAKAEASDTSYKAKVQAHRSKVKLQTSRSKAKLQTSRSKAKLQRSPKTLIVKSRVPIKNGVLGLANSETWDAILSKTFRVKIPPTMACAEEKKGKRKISKGS
nr:putative retrotransposon protein [Tanacetum cinerariifolium]